VNSAALAEKVAAKVDASAAVASGRARHRVGGDAAAPT